MHQADRVLRQRLDLRVPADTWHTKNVLGQLKRLLVLRGYFRPRTNSSSSVIFTGGLYAGSACGRHSIPVFASKALIKSRRRIGDRVCAGP
jgi:hypothetical protein